ncbi:MAG TPA: DNA phosphorothioation-associated protein 4 [Symbiobacteriaceae bacterium]|jgi:dnd system-associated protein 4
MPRRVRRPKDQDAVYKALKEGEPAVFETYKDILMMAACVGFKLDKRVPFEQTAEQIEWDVFSGRTDLPIINAIALKETGDVNILLEDDETFDRKFVILEEYANGGFEELKRRLLDSPGDALDNLIALIYEQKKADSTDAESLENMVHSLFQ